MSSLLKNCCCIMFGGGVCAAPFLNLASSEQTSADAKLSRLQTTSSSDSSRAEEEGNCLFIAGNDDSLSPSSEPTYFSFSCDNKGSNDSVITSGLTIWIPKERLKEPSTSFKSGKRIRVKTQTSNITSSGDSYGVYEHRTSFESESFIGSSIIGEWGKNSVIWRDSSNDQVEERVYRAKVSDSEDVHLFLQLKQQL